jgi:hypothetical protein
MQTKKGNYMKVRNTKLSRIAGVAEILDPKIGMLGRLKVDGNPLADGLADFVLGALVRRVGNADEHACVEVLWNFEGQGGQSGGIHLKAIP